MNLRERGGLVEALSSSMGHGGQNLSTAIGALERTIDEDAWREFITRDGRHVTPQSFEVFVSTPPLQGLGVDLDLVRRVVGNNDRLRDKLDILVKHPHGGDHRKIDNVNLAPVPDGNSKERALRALRKKRPELHARVIAGELSPNAAAIEAGFRHPMISVRADDPAAFIRAGLRRYTREQLRAALDASEE